MLRFHKPTQYEQGMIRMFPHRVVFTGLAAKAYLFSFLEKNYGPSHKRWWSYFEGNDEIAIQFKSAEDAVSAKLTFNA